MNKRELNLNYDYSTERLLSIDDDDANTYNRTLLSFSYTNGLLSAVVAPTVGKSVCYSYTGSQLSAVSKVQPSSYGYPLTNDWQYGYVSINGKSILNQVTTKGGTAATGSPVTLSNVTASVSYNPYTGRPWKQSDSSGNSRVYKYDDAVNSSVVSSLPRDAASPTDVANPANTWNVLFDALGRSTKFTNISSDATTLTFDALDPSAPNTVSVPTGGTQQVVHDPAHNGNVTQTVTQGGVTTNYQYIYSAAFPLGLLHQIQTVGKDGSVKQPTTIEYFLDDPTNGYFGQIKSITTPAPGTTTSNNPGTVTVSYAYTAGLGNLATVTMPTAVQSTPPTYTTVTYDYGGTESLGEPASVTTQMGGGASGQPITNRTTSFTYDNRGNLLSTKDPLNRETTYEYNDQDQVTAVHLPFLLNASENRLISFDYAEQGKPATKTTLSDSAGNPFRVAYNGSTSEWMPKNVLGNVRTAAQTVDSELRLNQVTNGNTINGNSVNAFSYSYAFGTDASSNPIRSVTTAAGGTTRTTGLDAGGSAVTTQNALGTTTFNRNPNVDNNVYAVQYAGSSSGLATTYDGFNRIIVMDDPVGRIEFTYDDQDNVVTELRRYYDFSTGWADQADIKKTFTYYPNGQRSSMDVKLPAYASYDRVKYLYGYDLAGLMVSLDVTSTNTNGDNYSPVDKASTRYSYNLDGTLKSKKLLYGTSPLLQTDYEYDRWSRLSKLTNSDFSVDPFKNSPSGGTAYGTVSLFDTFTYDPASNLTGYQASYYATDQKLANNRRGDTCAFNFAYTAKDELQTETSNTHTTYTTSQVNQTFSYDGAGNILSLRGIGFTPNTSTDRIIGDTVGAVQYAYDAEGNLTTGGRAYDAYSRLSTNTDGGGAQYTYWYDGTRAEKLSPNSRTHYVYDGLDLVCEFTGPDANHQYTPGNFYTYGPAGLEAKLSGLGNLANRAYFFDPTGNLAQRIDLTPVGGAQQTQDTFDIGAGFVPEDVEMDHTSSEEMAASPGPILARVESNVIIDAYGKTILDQPNIDGTNYASYPPDWVGYKGQHGYYGDLESGLYYCHARYYAPGLGRWLTRDPLGLEGGINGYEYCGGNPIGRIDPSGFDPTKRKLTFIIGDVKGPIAIYLYGLVLQNSYRREFGSNYDIEILSAPTEAQVVDAYVRSDAIVHFGHGGATSGIALRVGHEGNSDKGDFKNVKGKSDGGSYFTWYDMNKAAAERTKAGKGKLDFLNIHCCSVFSNERMQRSILGISNMGIAYEGWTYNTDEPFVIPSPAAYLFGAIITHPKPSQRKRK